MRLCAFCGGTGRNSETGYRCEPCDGTGGHNYVNVLLMLAIFIMAAGLFFSFGDLVYALARWAVPLIHKLVIK